METDARAGSEIRIRKNIIDKVYGGVHEELPPHDNDAKDRLAARKQESPYSFQNICWLITSMAVFYYTDFASIVLYDPRVKRSWFNVGVLLVSVNITIGTFLIVFLSYIKKIHSDNWEHHYPAAIPIATACFAFGSCCLIVGLWPVWGFLTPVLLFVQFMGVVVIIAALPGF